MNKPEARPQRSDRTAKIDILGVLVDNLDLAQTVERLEKHLAERRARPDRPPWMIVTANPEYVMAARRDAGFRALINSAGLVTPDGVGLLLAGRVLRTPFRQRVTGVALCEALFESSARHGWRLFLLGGGPGVALEAARRIRQQYPGVCIAGTWAGPAGPEGDKEAVERIREAQAEVVLVAYGMVKQDRWSERNLEKCGASVALGVGGALDYKAGRTRLAPALVRRWGLEWLYRLYREPWRWRRQLNLLLFVAVLFKTRLRLAHPAKT